MIRVLLRPVPLFSIVRYRDSYSDNCVVEYWLCAALGGVFHYINSYINNSYINCYIKKYKNNSLSFLLKQLPLSTKQIAKPTGLLS